MAKDKVKQETTVDNLFEGWEEPTDDNFFGGDDVLVDKSVDNKVDVDVDVIDNDDDETQSKKDLDNSIKVIDDEDTPETKKAAKDKKQLDDILNFDNDDDGEEEEEVIDKTKESKTVATLNDLKERGLLDYELEEGEELTDERAQELIDDGYENNLNDKIGKMLEDLPPVTRDLVKYALNGGNESEFLKKLSTNKSVGLSENLDMDNEDNQKLVMSTDLKNQGYDDEYIEAQIDYLKDSGKLKSISTKAFAKVTEAEKAQRTSDVKAAEANKTALKEKKRVYRKDLDTYLSSLENVKGINLSKSDQKDLGSYMTDQIVDTGNGRATAFQKGLLDALQDKENSVLLAKLVKSNFDFSSIERNATSKKSKDIKKDVRRTGEKKTSTSGSSQKSKSKSLAEFFN